jgi:metal-responsive CopG/Arc/MetJ family transcriptional regulator
MDKLTVRIPEGLTDEIERIQSADDVSQSEAVRRLLRRGSEYDRIREERDRYERQYQQLVDHREEHTELVEYVEQERSLQERRERRQSAPVWKRAKWWLLGTPDGGDDAQA